MDPKKKELVEMFIQSCIEQGLTMDESAELSAHILISAVSANGKSHTRIEIANLGSVEVDC